MDSKEATAGEQNREIRNRTIDLEVEIKRINADDERILNTTEREKQVSVEKTEEHEIELKQIEISRQDFRKQMNKTEIELRKKLD